MKLNSFFLTCIFQIMMASGQIVTIGKDDFYHDVSVFVDRLDDILYVIPEEARL